MQVERYDLRDMKRATRKRRLECAPDIGLGFRVGGPTFLNQFTLQGPPVSSGLVHWYKTDRLLTQAVPGSTTVTNALDAVATPGSLVAESPTGVARDLIAQNSGVLQHGITRAVTGGGETGTKGILRVWVRKPPAQFTAAPWVYLQAAGTTFRAWFDMNTGTTGVTSGGCSSRIVDRRFSPNDGFTWYLLEMNEFAYTTGANGLFMSNANGTATWDVGFSEPSVVYDSIQFAQDKVNTWTDLGSSPADLVMATAGQKPMWNARSENLQGEPAIRFYDAHFLAHATAASWQFMHDGSGCSWALVWHTGNTSLVGNRCVFTTNGNSATATGVSLVYDHSTQRFKYDIGGAGNNKISHNPTAFTLDEAVRPHWFGSSLATVDSLDFKWWQDGSLITSGNPSGGLTVAVPGTGLNVGGATGFDGEIPELLIWNRSLATAEWNAVGNYFKSLYGTV